MPVFTMVAPEVHVFMSPAFTGVHLPISKTHLRTMKENVFLINFDAVAIEGQIYRQRVLVFILSIIGSFLDLVHQNHNVHVDLFRTS